MHNDESIFAMSRTQVAELEAFMKIDPAALERLAAKAGRSAPAASRESAGTIAVIPIFGVIEQRPTWASAIFGGVSTQRLGDAFRMAMADPQVRAVVFDISSGGGSVFGVTELANEIRAARGLKPVVAVVNSTAASAAYWLASSADEIVSTPSGISGSIGVFAIHRDFSGAEERAGIKTSIIAAGEHKADAVDGAPLSDAGRASMQAMVNNFHALFVADVAAGRGVAPGAVRSGYGKGLTLTATAAKSAGMIDRVATFDETLRRLSTEAGRESVFLASLRRDQFIVGDGERERRLRTAAATVVVV